MNTFIFTKKAKKVFLDLPGSVQSRILKKLKGLKEHRDILSLLRRLTDFGPATHRLRIGDYRLILELKKQKGDRMTFWVLDAGDRKEVYR